MTGKAVRCLGCQAVFTARSAPTVTRTAPPPPPRRELPAKPKRKARDDGFEPELPPIPRDRKVPAAIVVVGGAMALAIGLTIFLVVRYRDRKPDTAAPVVVKNDTKPVEGPAVAPKPEIDSKRADPPSPPADRGGGGRRHPGQGPPEQEGAGGPDRHPPKLPSSPRRTRRRSPGPRTLRP